MRPTCTILGANGYLGRHLTFYLHQKGYKVYAYDIQPERNSNIPKEILYESFDICRNYEHVNFDVDYLFVFSGITGTKNGFDNYKTFIEVNEIGLLNILTKVKNMERKPKIIFPSTRLVYKGEKSALPEGAEKEAKTIYAANKLACEHYLQMYANCFDVKYTAYRICVPYGNQFDGEFSYGTIGAFLNRAKSGGAITLYGDGEIKRTLTHVMSICQQIADSMTLIESDNRIFNIAGETFSLKELATRIASIYGTLVTYVPWNDMDLKIESGSTVFDESSIEKIISIDSQYDFTDWLEKIKA